MQLRETHYVQGLTKEWYLGCVNSHPAARGSQEAGFTQPRLLPSPVFMTLVASSFENEEEARGDETSLIVPPSVRPSIPRATKGNSFFEDINCAIRQLDRKQQFCGDCLYWILKRGLLSRGL